MIQLSWMRIQLKSRERAMQHNDGVARARIALFEALLDTLPISDADAWKLVDAVQLFIERGGRLGEAARPVLPARVLP